jgi:hypothetical protein
MYEREFMVGLELVAIAVLLFACIAIQALTLTALQRQFPSLETWLARHGALHYELLIVYSVIVVVIFMHVVQASIWAMFFHYGVGIDPLRDAFYHSILSLTTMDDSSGVLPERWRMLGAAEGLTGWMVFSWSTAWTFLFLTTLRDARKALHAGQGAAPKSSA